MIDLLTLIWGDNWWDRYFRRRNLSIRIGAFHDPPKPGSGVLLSLTSKIGKAPGDCEVFALAMRETGDIQSLKLIGPAPASQLLSAGAERRIHARVEMRWWDRHALLIHDDEFREIPPGEPFFLAVGAYSESGVHGRLYRAKHSPFSAFHVDGWKHRKLKKKAREIADLRRESQLI